MDQHEMPDYFFITGLPRSRTSWLAAFFTHGTSHCYHDEIARRCLHPDPFTDLLSRLDIVGKTHIGISDSSAAFWRKELLRLFPDAKWVFVNRPVDQVVKSYTVYFNRNPYPGQSPLDTQDLSLRIALLREDLARLKSLVQKERRFEVEFSELDSSDVCKSLWQWVLPDQPFEPERWKLFDSLVINPCARKEHFLGAKLP